MLKDIDAEQAAYYATHTPAEIAANQILIQQELEAPAKARAERKLQGKLARAAEIADRSEDDALLNLMELHHVA